MSPDTSPGYRRGMIGHNLLLAAALLLSPPSCYAEQLPPAGPLLCETLRATAVAWEILDPREAPFFFARPEELAEDLDRLRGRFLELADAPSVHDAERWPTRALATDYLDFNRAYRRTLEVRQVADRPRWQEYQTAVEETESLYQLWDTARDARCECYYVHFRRRALKRLRDRLGEDDYAAGRLPPPVPLWRFRPID